MVSMDNFGRCDSGKFEDANEYNVDDPDSKKVESDMVLAHDAEGYAAGTEVGPDFGCIHFVEKN